MFNVLGCKSNVEILMSFRKLFCSLTSHGSIYFSPTLNSTFSYKFFFFSLLSLLPTLFGTKGENFQFSRRRKSFKFQTDCQLFLAVSHVAIKQPSNIHLNAVSYHNEINTISSIKPFIETYEGCEHINRL